MSITGAFDDAMTLNGFLYCAALNFNPEPMVKALECGVPGVSLLGTGPSFVALVDEEKGERLGEVWSGLGVEGKIIRSRVNNKQSF